MKRKESRKNMSLNPNELCECEGGSKGMEKVYIITVIAS